MLTLERWHESWRHLGMASGPDDVFRDLIARYAEPHRHYHTAQHVEECFAQWEFVRDGAERAGEVELALWFHDAVYDPHRDDNEAQSAELARETIASAGLPPLVADRVEALILATRHDSPPPTADAARLVDVDLAILAAPPDRFDEYEAQVRSEYAWVPEFLFRKKRLEVLERFLARPSIFSTGHFQRVAEARARQNLGRSLAALAG